LGSVLDEKVKWNLLMEEMLDKTGASLDKSPKKSLTRLAVHSVISIGICSHSKETSEIATPQFY
jgi:hypothetical protein